MENIGTISFRVDRGGSTLSVTGPAVSVGPVTVNPTVGVQRDRQGRYHFVIGDRDNVIAPAQIPRQLRSALQSLAGGGRSTPFTVRMPGITDIQERNGRFISYSEYNNRRVSRLITPVWWPVLSQSEYNGYVRLCQLILTQLAPGRRRASTGS